MSQGVHDKLIIKVEQAKKPEHYAGLDLGKSFDSSALCVFRKQLVDETGEEPVPIIAKVHPPETPVVSAEVAVKAPKRDRPTSRYDGWLIQKLDLGTPYPDIVGRVTGLFQRPEMIGQTLVIDGTGVGEPVVDMFRRARTDAVKCPKCHGQGFVTGEIPGLGTGFMEAEACLVCMGHGKIKLNAKIRPVYISGGEVGSAKFSTVRDGFRVSKVELISVLEVLLQTNPGRMWIDPRSKWASALADEFANFRVKKKATSVNETLEAWRERDHDDLVLACAIALWVAERGVQRFNMWL
jgi:hypothetical protein